MRHIAVYFIIVDLCVFKNIGSLFVKVTHLLLAVKLDIICGGGGCYNTMNIFYLMHISI